MTCQLTDRELNCWIALHICGWTEVECGEPPLFSAGRKPCGEIGIVRAYSCEREAAHDMLEAVADRGVEAKNLFMACLILDGKQDGHVFDLLLTEPRELCEAAYETFKNSVTKET